MKEIHKTDGNEVNGFPPLADYKECMRKPIEAIANCSHLLKQSCGSGKIMGTKILRARISFLNELLKDFPKMKVIHQLRDPRGTVLSRRTNNRLYKKDIVEEARLLCMKMADDIKTRYMLEQEFPGVFLETKYEHLATRPVDTVAKIYKHIGINHTDHVNNWIKGATNGKETGAFSLSRKNSTATAHAWMNKLTAEEKQGIDKVCNEVYQLAGYDR